MVNEQIEKLAATIAQRWTEPYGDDRADLTENIADAIRTALASVQGEPVAWLDDGRTRSGSNSTSYRVVTAETKRSMPASVAAVFATPLYAAPALAKPEDASAFIEKEGRK